MSFSVYAIPQKEFKYFYEEVLNVRGNLFLGAFGRVGTNQDGLTLKEPWNPG